MSCRRPDLIREVIAAILFRMPLLDEPVSPLHFRLLTRT